ncbi:MAG: glycosyltransferase family 9 protein [Desulfovibrio sp.]|jgi:ADP-heptose:LPS heptosyltransferase|nr:glycosyltransferase family 9 protein [Desulfovibrio sp.]
MNEAPILVLQMQRMGDLVLSFPLLAGLGRMFPGHPLIVLGEKTFFEPLLPLSPAAVYFEFEAAAHLERQRYHLVVNLSHRPEAAALAGRLQSERSLGPRSDSAGRLYVDGNWQLYRASLTHNNYYNMYHWADLHGLDIFPARTAPRPCGRRASGFAAGKGGARIGLFLGASEAAKRPDAAFWAGLCRRLLEFGHKPVLLGGVAEQELGRDVAARLHAHALNLAGRFSVRALADFIASLDLFITPDTGPMHIADYLGVPVLNLSLGPVNPRETGPFSSGQFIVQADLECAGCWHCTRPRAECRDLLSDAAIALLTRRLLGSAGTAVAGARHPGEGVRLLRSKRDALGLYDLESLFPLEENAGAAEAAGSDDPRKARMRHPAATACAAGERSALSRFWKTWFGSVFGLLPQDAAVEAHRRLRVSHLKVDAELSAAAAAFALKSVAAFRTRPDLMLDSPDFWRQAPHLLRPFSGYAQMYAQNCGGTRQAFLDIVSLAEALAESDGPGGRPLRTSA